MEAMGETKVCPHCAETIKAPAKVCPHCRYAQKRWSLYNPQLLAASYIAVCCVAMICAAIFLDKIFGPKRQYGDYRDDIIVASSQLSRRVSESNMVNTVVGTLTNRGQLAWKDVSVEAQFFNKAGKQIDAITAKDYPSLIILPHGEVSFKIESLAARPEADYESYKAVVRWAKDVDAWP
jgi:hypothetical protein